MGFRFRKIITLVPGVRVNISKRGASVSLGGRGATVNLGTKGARTTYGLPGSGVSYSRYTPYGKRGSILPWVSVLLCLCLAGLMAYFHFYPSI